MTTGLSQAGTALAAPLPAPDRQAMVEAVRLLHPGRVVELRVLHVDGRGWTASGYFDQPLALAEAALRYNRRAEGVYITLNPVSTMLLSRANNALKEHPQQTTTDAEALRRVWLPIDLDPTRPSGIASSEAEHEAALEQARAVRAWLSEQGWHAPLFADSGNGAHLLYAIDLPNDAESADLVKRVLSALAERFDTPEVKLDRSVYNAARIWKLYGSVARKGEHRPERPHRLARIIEAPDPIEPVTRAQLAALAGPVPPASSWQTVRRLEGGGTGGSVSEDALLAWLERHDAAARQTKREAGRVIVVLERCPFNPEHHEAGKACVTLSDEGVPGFRCQAAGCAEQHWGKLVKLWGDRPLPVPPASGWLNAGRQDGGGTGMALHLPRTWPEPPGQAAYYGLAGEIVRAVEPHSEADPVAVLAHLLVAFGCAVGRGPHMLVGATRHEARLFAVIAGQSANARKGDSWAVVEALLRAAEVGPPVLTSLSSGEGLIRQVCDEVSEMRPVKGPRGQQQAYEKVVTLAGVTDKRLLIVTSEMGGLFQVMRRESNIITATLRDAWDRGNLVVPTRADPLRATGAYLAFAGHITEEELRHDLTGLHAANGFANRFCFFAVRRSKQLSRPRRLTDAALAPLAARLRVAIERARQVGLMDFSPNGAIAWDQTYADLSRGRFGFAGALLSRAPAQMLRLGMLYALLDGAAQIDVEHLRAAAALWGYAERSVEYLFGDTSGDPLADKIEAALQEHSELTRKQLWGVLGHRMQAEELDRALEALEAQGKISREHRASTGRGPGAVVLHWCADAGNCSTTVPQ